MKPHHFVRLGLLVLGIAAASCGSVREGTGTSFLMVEQLEFAEGANQGTFLTTLHSDINPPSEAQIDDVCRVSFSLGLKDPGPAASANAPTANQFITVDRYHVKFIRADGRNVQGVDVPYEFDGALTALVGAGRTQTAFVVVRHNAKREAPLAVLGTNVTKISMIVEITFYGRDQTDHEAQVSARSSIEFGAFESSSAAGQ
jgi:hypothetical protein